MAQTGGIRVRSSPTEHQTVKKGFRYPFELRTSWVIFLAPVSGLPEPIAKLQCPHCQTRLDVFETASGGRTIAVTILGPTVEQGAKALETFQAADDGPRITCPACAKIFDPSGPYRPIRPLGRTT